MPITETHHRIDATCELYLVDNPTQDERSGNSEDLPTP